MKVLFLSRKTVFSSPGGDTVQMLKTKKYLEKHGLKVHISTDLNPPLSGYDLVHAFNLMRPQEVWLQVRNARKWKVPVILSPIYGLYTEYERKGRSFPLRTLTKVLNPYQVEYLKIIARALLGKEMHRGAFSVMVRGFYKCAKEIVEMSDILLPNSEGEMRRIVADFKMQDKPYMVVPNAVDKEIFSYERTQVPGEFKKYTGAVLCVARIEGRKSQLSLVRAAKNLPYTFVLVGAPGKHHKRYYEKVRREAPPNVKFLGPLPHEKLPGLYKVAKVHVLPSWMETPGLSSLEAGAMLCNIVVSDRGDTREYFGDLAFYCEPDDPESIRKAIIEAYNAPPPYRLQKLILENYTWEKAAQKTLEAYEKVLSGPRK